MKSTLQADAVADVRVVLSEKGGVNLGSVTRMALYAEWDYLVGLLDSENAYRRAALMNILANLAAADKEGRFERIFGRYFDLLDDPSVMVARYVARNAGKIARSKPGLQARITKLLLDIGSTYHRPGRRDLIKADVIAWFGEYSVESGDRERMMAFVGERLDCSSPKARKEAKSFPRRYGDWEHASVASSEGVGI